MNRLSIGLAMAILALAVSRAGAALIAYDSFSNSPAGVSLLAAGSSGTGFSDNWHPGGFNASNSSNYTVAPGSLSDGALATAANSVSTAAQTAISGVTRDLSTPLGAVGTTDYFSVLLRPDGALSGGVFNNFFGLYLDASNTTMTSSQDVFIGKPGNGPMGDYDVENRGGTNQADSGVAAVTGQTVLLVLRADFTASGDKFTLYVDPTPGGTEPLTGTVMKDTDVGMITGLTLYSTGAFGVDEIRVGTTYADVVPTTSAVTFATVPEPSSVVLTSLGVLGILGAARLIRRARAGVISA